MARHYQTFDNKELYPSPEEKAAAILECLISNHPFIDGNKRMGFVLMMLIILEAGYKITATQDELYDFIVHIATGKTDTRNIVEWLQHHIVRSEP